MLEAIVFDFDGVVVDSEPMHFRAFGEISQPLGFELTWDRYLSEMIGYDDRDAFRFILTELGKPIDDQHIAGLCQQKQEAIDRIIAEGVPMIPGARALIEETFAAPDTALAIASGATRRDIELMLDGLELRERFEIIVSADDVEHSKPHPRTYALAAEKIGIQPARCLAIEDTTFGLQSARGAGMMTLGLTTTGSREALQDAQRVEANLEGIDLKKLKQWYG